MKCHNSQNQFDTTLTTKATQYIPCTSDLLTLNYLNKSGFLLLSEKFVSIACILIFLNLSTMIHLKCKVAYFQTRLSLFIFSTSWGRDVADIAAVLVIILQVLLHLFRHGGRRFPFCDSTADYNTCRQIFCPPQVWKNHIPGNYGTVEKQVLSRFQNLAMT